MSPAFDGSLAIWHLELSDVIEIRDEITFSFYTGLPHIDPSEHVGGNVTVLT